MQHGAFANIEQIMATRLIEAEPHLTSFTQRAQARAAAGVRRRKVRRTDLNPHNPLRHQRVADAILHKHSIARRINVLELAPAACGVMHTLWRGVMRAGCDAAIITDHISRRGERHMAAICGNAIAPPRKADDC